MQRTQIKKLDTGAQDSRALFRIMHIFPPRYPALRLTHEEFNIGQCFKEEDIHFDLTARQITVFSI